MVTRLLLSSDGTRCWFCPVELIDFFHFSLGERYLLLKNWQEVMLSVFRWLAGRDLARRLDCGDEGREALGAV